jgi:hypothetical protein
MRLKLEQLDISIEKITEYLLVFKLKNDKSKFLLSVGYTLENWEQPLKDIIEIAVNNNLILQKVNEFGNLYLISGKLKNKRIVTIWLQQINHDTYRFITLYPNNYEEKI